MSIVLARRPPIWLGGLAACLAGCTARTIPGDTGASLELGPNLIARADFGDGTEDSGFRQECAFPYSCTLADLGGRTVMAFEVHAEDYDHGDRSTKSAELKTFLLTGYDAYQQTREFWAGFRFLVPEGGIAAGDLVILAQQHGERDRSLGERGRNPVSGLAVRDGVLAYSYRGDSRALSLPPGEAEGGFDPRCTTPTSTYTDCGGAELMTLESGQWYRVVLHEVHDYTGGGSIAVDVAEEDATGATLRTSHFARDGVGVSFNDLVGPYWKFGLYKAEAPPTQEVSRVYFDEVRVGVGPGRSLDYEPL